LEPEVWRRVLSVNLEGTFHMCQAFARMAKQAQTPAAIVNLTSAAGIRGVFAISQPEDVDINEILFRPTLQEV
jgi:NAD(P)-dependent dehydrogenase (short-subunit alcohol dehydrogenase family)